MAKPPCLLIASVSDGVVMLNDNSQIMELYGISIVREINGNMSAGAPDPVCR